MRRDQRADYRSDYPGYSKPILTLLHFGDEDVGPVSAEYSFRLRPMYHRPACGFLPFHPEAARQIA
jgi:hypothetical protein